MQGLLAAMRAPGVQLIIEDVCVPPARVAEAAKDLQALLGRHGFLQGVAGHASAGNLHFLLTPNFGEPADLDRYDAFMHELVELIVDTYDGSLKAEHGTGVNMAPYVEREWGAKATELMWRVKQLADPDGILAPGVLLNREPGAHLRNLKSTPEIDEVATQCIECGFCEPVCPSRDLTTTPRQRIAAAARDGPPARGLAGAGGAARAVPLRRHGDVRRRRLLQPRVSGRDRHGRAGEAAAGRRARPAGRARCALEAARRWSTVEGSARAALRAGANGADGALRALTGAGRRLLGDELIPAWTSAMPSPAPARPARRNEPRGGRRRVLPRLHQPHLRQPPLAGA